MQILQSFFTKRSAQRYNTGVPEYKERIEFFI